MKVKEVYVGVLTGKDGKGEITEQSIMFAGPNPFIPKGIYTEDSPPPGWAWEPFLAKAIKHDGFGVVVVYEGAEQPDIRAAMDKDAAEARKATAEQDAVRKRMVGGRHVAPETKVEPKVGGDK